MSCCYLYKDPLASYYGTRCLLTTNTDSSYCELHQKENDIVIEYYTDGKTSTEIWNQLNDLLLENIISNNKNETVDKFFQLLEKYSDILTKDKVCTQVIYQNYEEMKKNGWSNAEKYAQLFQKKEVYDIIIESKIKFILKKALTAIGIKNKRKYVEKMFELLEDEGLSYTLSREPFSRVVYKKLLELETKKKWGYAIHFREKIFPTDFP
jgi:hypothetical protein